MSEEETNRLIAAALTNALGPGQFELVSVRCLDAHLQGHAFKYAGRSERISGVYPYRIEYRAKDGSPRAVDAMVKAKPDEAAILAVYQGLLDRCGIKLKSPLAGCLKNSDYSTPNLKEAVLFRDFEARLKPYVPPSLGVYIDPATSYTLRLEETLPPGSVILDPDDDTTRRWEPSFSRLTLEGLADIHARFYGDCRDLLATGYFHVSDRTVMASGRDLWEAFYDFLRASYADVMTPAAVRRHRSILDGLEEWCASADRQPKTLLYGDANPQNLAFARTAEGFKLSVFDWERAVVGLPQRDLAEHMIYTLPESFGKEAAQEQIEVYRAAFDRTSASRTDRSSFLAGLVWALDDLIVNRLPLMMIVKRAAGKRRHADAAYVKAHRLLNYFG